MLADTVDADKPGVEELYESATNTSNMKQDAERRMPADVLRDMAMSTNRLGAALHRLRGQWESSVKPERQHPRSVKQFLEIFGDKDRAALAHETDKRQCEQSYERALNGLANRLTDLEAVLEGLFPVVMKRGWGKPTDPITRSERSELRELDAQKERNLRAAAEAAAEDEKEAARKSLNDFLIAAARARAEEDREDRERAKPKIGQVIRYWLDQTCPRCGGTKWQRVAGTNRQSTKVCPHPRDGGCGGTGYIEPPHGQEGRWLANYMDECAHKHRQNLKARKKAFSAIPPIDRLSKRMQPSNDED